MPTETLTPLQTRIGLIPMSGDQQAVDAYFDRRPWLIGDIVRLVEKLREMFKDNRQRLEVRWEYGGNGPEGVIRQAWTGGCLTSGAEQADERLEDLLCVDELFTYPRTPFVMLEFVEE